MIIRCEANEKNTHNVFQRIFHVWMIIIIAALPFSFGPGYVKGEALPAESAVIEEPVDLAMERLKG